MADDCYVWKLPEMTPEEVAAARAARAKILRIAARRLPNPESWLAAMGVTPESEQCPDATKRQTNVQEADGLGSSRARADERPDGPRG